MIEQSNTHIFSKLVSIQINKSVIYIIIIIWYCLRHNVETDCIVAVMPMLGLEKEVDSKPFFGRFPTVEPYILLENQSMCSAIMISTALCQLGCSNISMWCDKVIQAMLMHCIIDAILTRIGAKKPASMLQVNVGQFLPTMWHDPLKAI